MKTMPSQTACSLTKRCQTPVRVLRLRIKDKHTKVLLEMARAVNLVWNYCNDLSMQVLRRENRFIGVYELQTYLKGASREGLSVGSVVCQLAEGIPANAAEAAAA